MQLTNLNIDKWYRTTVCEFAALAIFFLVGCFPTSSFAQQPGQKTFPSSEEAGNSLVAAMQSKNEKALLELLGPDGKQIISSGDEIEDSLHTRADFVQRYLEMHRLAIMNRMELPFYTSGPGTGRRPYRSSTMLMAGISTPRRARRKSCIGEWAAMKCRPFAFARSSPRRSTNTTTRSARGMRRPSSAMKGNTTVFIGRWAPANPRVPSDRWWRTRSRKATRREEAALRLPIVVTTSIS